MKEQIKVVPILVVFANQVVFTLRWTKVQYVEPLVIQRTSALIVLDQVNLNGILILVVLVHYTC